MSYRQMRFLGYILRKGNLENLVLTEKNGKEQKKEDDSGRAVARMAGRAKS